MKWEELNSAFSSFSQLRNSNKKVSKDVIKAAEQDISGLFYEVYKLSEDVYVRLTISSDSYGDNEFVSGLEFVQPKQKVVTSYETKTDNTKKGLSYEQILANLKEHHSVSEFAHRDYDSVELGLGTTKEIVQHGGEEQGSDWYSIQHFVDHDIYIKVSGYYSSYDGVDFSEGWDSCEEVKPQQKNITVYE